MEVLLPRPGVGAKLTLARREARWPGQVWPTGPSGAATKVRQDHLNTK